MYMNPVPLQLAICATIKDDLVGITSVADYLLWMLNSHENFSYVEHMGLEGPEDEGTIMLAKAGAKLGLFRAFKDVSQVQKQLDALHSFVPYPALFALSASLPDHPAPAPAPPLDHSGKSYTLEK